MARRSYGRRSVETSNEDKVLWPEDGYTKGDLISYYRAIAEWMLPYLRDRPVVQTRFPDGIHGKSFFQKDAPEWAPAWLRRETVWSDGSERELSYFIADDAPSLEYLANTASIPLHIWSSRIDAPGQPDWCSLDLDPKGAPFDHVIQVAQAVHRLCDGIGLPNYVKTSGSSGLHVLIPLGRQCTHEQAKLLGELLAREIVRELPDVATMARVVSQREGKVYVDYLQNGHGKLLVAPFSVRPLAGGGYSPVRTIADLVSLVQAGVLEFHPFGSRVDDLEHPDLIVFDLDPSTQKFAEVRAAAASSGVVRGLIPVPGNRANRCDTCQWPSSRWYSTGTPASFAASTRRSMSPRMISSLAPCTNIGGRPDRLPKIGETSGHLRLSPA